MENNKIEWYADNRRSNASQIHHSKMHLPLNIDEAYYIQKEVIEKLGGDVGGWKLGGTNSVTRRLFNCSQPYWGPIFSDKIFDFNSAIDLSGMLEIKGEVEVIFRLSHEIDSLSEIDLFTDVTRYVDLVAPGVELPSTCFSDLLDGGIELLIADLCGTGALVTGKFIAIDEYSDKYALEASMTQNNKTIAEGNTRSIHPSTIGALADFLYLANKNGVHLKKGQYISTGGCTDCSNLELNSEIGVHLDGFDEFTFKIENMKDDSNNA